MEDNLLEIAQLPEVKAAIEEYIEYSPTEVALKKGVPHPRYVATQVKYLQRARKKLPSYYAARAIMPSIAFEQSSSEECAAHKHHSGHLAIDLTCGLGVDTLYLAKQFDRVIAIERNAELADITRHNLRAMGAENVEVLCGAAEEILATLPRADMIYADPDRRNTEGKKVVVLEECSPNIRALWPQLTQLTDHIVLKLSPMFDVVEAARIVPEGANVEVLSLGGECKEVLIDWLAPSLRQGPTTITASVVGQSSLCLPQSRPSVVRTEPHRPEEYRYVVVPDVAVRKAGIVAEWCVANSLEVDNNYGFATELKEPCTMGRTYQIEEALPYQPKQLARRVGGKMELIRHGFPLSSAAILKALKAKEGSGTRWAFAELDGKLWAFRLK